MSVERPLKICLVYDCLFPHTVGGAERWYRNLAERLVGEGHEVTYLTLRQWDRGADPGVAGVAVRAVGTRMRLYAGPGRRRVLPPLAFGIGVLWHLIRHGRRYDVVHTASFPYFSLLAAALARPRGRYRIVVDWHEVWSRDYWREYLGRIPGLIGWLIQRLCVRVPQRAFCFSRLHADRLRAHGLRGQPTTLTGEYARSPGPPSPARASARLADPLVVFAGRHIPEKRAVAVVPGVALARMQVPELRAAIFGDGPERPAVLRAVIEHGLGATIDVPGFVAAEAVQLGLARAMCLLLPSRREGYGLVVVEAAAQGTPSIVVRGPDNAAVELVEDGVNGVIARSADPEDLAAAILRVHAAGQSLRDSTAEWFMRHADPLSLESSLSVVVDCYRAVG
jgi:glycosyltransferase involved in cell wall biosynthesis